MMINENSDHQDKRINIWLFIAPCLYLAIFMPLLTTNPNIPETIKVLFAILGTIMLFATLGIAWRQGKLRLPILLSFVGLVSGLVLWAVFIS